MAVRQVKALVLKRFPIRETSLVVFFFSREIGKFSGILKGIRRDPKKFNSSVDLFTLNEVLFYPSRISMLHLVSKCNLLDLPISVSTKRNYWLAGYFARLIDIVTTFEQPNPTLFDMFLSALKLLGKVEEKVLIRIFEIKLLDLIGFRPYIDGCVSCLQRDFIRAWFSNKEGGLLCSKCSYKDYLALEVSPGIIKTIRAIEKLPMEKAKSIRLGRAQGLILDNIVHQFLEYHLDIEVGLVN